MQIMTLASIVADMPLQEFIAAAEHGDTIGPFIDPTLWREASATIGEILDLARSLHSFQDQVLTSRSGAAQGGANAPPEEQ